MTSEEKEDIGPSRSIAWELVILRRFQLAGVKPDYASTQPSWPDGRLI